MKYLLMWNIRFQRKEWTYCLYFMRLLNGD